MLERIGIVTDSTADLPLDYYQKHNVVLVPLTVRFGEEVFKDWTEMPPSKFYPCLKEVDVLPKTSQPSPYDFAEAYRKLAKQCDHVFSVHLSSKLSGTIESAETAKGMVDAYVTVVDTKLASLGTGIVVDALVKERDATMSFRELETLAENVSKNTRLLFSVATLKYLEMGGRIGKAQALLGSLLNIKPILTLEDGLVAPYKKVKGERKIYETMVDFLVEGTKGKKFHLGFAHADNPGAIARLKEMIDKKGLKPASIIEGEIGAVIGTYTGPEAFAVLYRLD